MRYLLLLGLLLTSQQSFAATTYLNTACTFNGTGASGTCAASGGANGAYNTGASIFWSTIGAGNTLFIARGTTTSNWAGIIVDTGVTIDDYTGNAPGTTDTCPIWTRSGSQTFMMSITADNVTVNDICVTGTATSALISSTAANTSINRVNLTTNLGTGVGMRFNNGASNGSMTDSRVNYIYDDGVGISSSATGLFTITNLTCDHVDLALGTGDCIQVYDSASASLTVSGGTYTKETGFKQAIRFYSTGTLTIKNRPVIRLLAANAQGVSVTGAGNLIIESLTASGVGGAPLLFINNSGTSRVNNCELTGSDYGIWSSIPGGSLRIQNCNIYNSTTAGIYNTIDTTGGTTEVYNTFIRAPISLYNANTSAVLKADYNTYAIPLFRWNGATVSTLATWRSTSSQDTNSQSKSGPETIRTIRN